MSARDMLNDPELRKLTSKLIEMCEDPGGMGDHVIYQHAAIAAELCKLYERGADERTADIIALLHEHSEHLSDNVGKVVDAICARWPEP
jgi:hypothetical protein